MSQTAITTGRIQVMQHQRHVLIWNDIALIFFQVNVLCNVFAKLCQNDLQPGPIVKRFNLIQHFQMTCLAGSRDKFFKWSGKKSGCFTGVL